MDFPKSELPKYDLSAFARKAIYELDGTEISRDPYLDVIESPLNDFSEGAIRRLIVNLPPRTLKTLFCSIVLSAWLLAHDPTLKILLITYSQDLAENIARAIRTILEAPWFKRLFPSTRIKKGHAQVRNFATTAGGQVYAVSFDGAITGFGGDVIIIDDPHNISDVDFLGRIERTVDRFKTIVKRRLNNPKKGRILVVAHRVHEHDLSAHLLATGRYTHVALPMIATRDQTYRTNYGSWRRRKGELLRPDADDIDELNQLREELVNPDFELLYQQDTEGQSFPSVKLAHFGRYELDEILNLPRFVSVDPGLSKEEGCSFSVAQVWATDWVNFYLIDQFRARCDFIDLVKGVKGLARRNFGAPILIEKTANGHALLSGLTRKQQRRAIPILPLDSKTRRFRRHLPKIVGAHVKLPKNGAFVDGFMKEIVEFPHGRYDDQVDAMVQFFDWLEKQDPADFSNTNVPERALGAIARGSDSPLGLSLFGSNWLVARASDHQPLPSLSLQTTDGRALAAIARGSLSNPFRRS
jgi:phage terminase large subunit-like protein